MKLIRENYHVRPSRSESFIVCILCVASALILLAWCFAFK